MEISILEGIAAMHTPVLTAILLFLTYIGEWGAVCIATAAVLLCFGKTRKAGVVTAFALLADFLIVNVILKNAVARQRPFEEEPLLCGFLSEIGYPLPKDYSFPSGHSAVTFCGAAALTYFFRGKGAWAFLPAALIAFSRLYLGVHYPTDVLAGAAIGCGVGFGVAWAGNLLFEKAAEAHRRKKNRQTERAKEDADEQ